MYQASIWASTLGHFWALIIQANGPHARVSDRARREKPISGLCGPFGQVSQKIARGSQIALFWAEHSLRDLYGSDLPRDGGGGWMVERTAGM